MKMTEKRKYTYEWLYRAAVLTVLGVLLSGFIKYVPVAISAINNRTFDSNEQKEDVKRLLNKVDVFTPIEKEQLLQHTRDFNIHMSADEKESMIIIRENQKRIGQDLQEIKNLLKKQK